MSVKASDRKPSKMQFEVLSNEVRDDVSRVLTNKRLVEPKWKYIIAVPGVQMAELICWYIKAANFIWPKDETALMARRELQYKAIGACGALADFLFWAMRKLDRLDVNGKDKELEDRFGKIGEKLNKLVACLKGWQEKDTIKASEQ